MELRRVFIWKVPSSTLVAETFPALIHLNTVDRWPPRRFFRSLCQGIAHGCVRSLLPRQPGTVLLHR